MTEKQITFWSVWVAAVWSKFYFEGEKQTPVLQFERLVSVCRPISVAQANNAQLLQFTRYQRNYFLSFFYHSQFLVNSAIAPFSVQARLSTNKHSAVAFGYFCFQRCTVRILGDCTGVHLSPFCPTVWSVRRQRHMLDHKFCLKKHSSPDRLDEPNNPHLSTTYQHNTLVFSQLLLNAQ